MEVRMLFEAPDFFSSLGLDSGPCELVAFFDLTLRGEDPVVENVTVEKIDGTPVSLESLSAHDRRDMDSEIRREVSYCLEERWEELLPRRSYWDPETEANRD